VRAAANGEGGSLAARPGPRNPDLTPMFPPGLGVGTWCP
jgi:hypothetical protein